jgi:hypothetical protein
MSNLWEKEREWVYMIIENDVTFATQWKVSMFLTNTSMAVWINYYELVCLCVCVYAGNLH